MVPWYHPGTNCTRSLLGSFVKTLTPWLHPRSPEAELSGVKVKVKVSQSCPTLCDPMDCGPPGSSVHRFSREEYWSELLFPSPGVLPNPRIKPRSPALQADSLPSGPPGKPIVRGRAWESGLLNTLQLRMQGRQVWTKKKKKRS